MKKLIMGLSFVSLLVMGLAACSNKNENSSGGLEDSTESSQELTTPKEFPSQFLGGNYEDIYSQTSQAFQDNVTLKQFKDLGVDFNKNVKNYELISEMPFQGLTEYQWVSDTGDKGIQSYFADDLTIEGLQLMPISTYPESDQQYTENTYRMPIKEEWFTFWGGTNELVNYHYAVESQRYAYDLVIVEGDSSFDGEQTENDSYYAFGKDVVAPLDGVVVSTANDISDNTPSVDTNTEKPLGNHVIIEHENNEYSVIAHLKKGSLEVNEGDEVGAGDLLGLAGNSGNSSEAHIHFHVADGMDWKEASSIRIKLEGGAEPVRGDTVSGF